MKVVLINHTFQIPRFYKRWQMLAHQHPDLDITLIAPLNFEWHTKNSMIFGEDVKTEGHDLHDANFKIIAVPIHNFKTIGWRSTEMVNVIKRIQPNIVYHIGGHTQLSLVQCIRAVRTLNNTKMMTFSMRGPAMNLSFPKIRSITNLPAWCLSYVSFLLRKHNLKYFNRYSDAVVCHYPDAIACFRKEGYNGPIYMSTQVGVDPDYYHPDEEGRNRIRAKYNLGNAFVFGSAARFIPQKGLEDIIAALPQEGNWKCLLMGKGTQEYTDNLKKLIASRNLSDRIILTGYVEWDEIASYWNAIDCAIHVPRTTEKWEETFSLAVVQAMATGKPIIGDTSGSVPYQIGPNGIIVNEGDISALREKMIWFIHNQEKARVIGNKMKEYALNSFSLQHLNDHIYEIFKAVDAGTFDPSLVDMVTFKNE